jgi:chloramphenicol 3-O-phosphotransferase
MSTDNILLILVAITGLSVLLQLAVLVAILVAVRKAVKEAEAKTEEIRSAVMPLFTTTRDLIVRIEPKLDAAATDLAEMTHALHVQATGIQASAEEVMGRVKQQAARVDGMTTAVLDRVDRVGGFLNGAINVSIRQISGVVAAAKAIVDTLRDPSPPRRPTPGPSAMEDKNLFV